MDEKIVMTLAKGNTYREGLKKWKNSRLLPVRALGGLTSPETSEGIVQRRSKMLVLFHFKIHSLRLSFTFIKVVHL